jgi:hypothetical protein
MEEREMKKLFGIIALIVLMAGCSITNPQILATMNDTGFKIGVNLVVGNSPYVFEQGVAEIGKEIDFNLPSSITKVTLTYFTNPEVIHIPYESSPNGQDITIIRPSSTSTVKTLPVDLLTTESVPLN